MTDQGQHACLYYLLLSQAHYWRWKLYVDVVELTRSHLMVALFLTNSKPMTSFLLQQNIKLKIPPYYFCKTCLCFSKTNISDEVKESLIWCFSWFPLPISLRERIIRYRPLFPANSKYNFEGRGKYRYDVRAMRGEITQYFEHFRPNYSKHAWKYLNGASKRTVCPVLCSEFEEEREKPAEPQARGREGAHHCSSQPPISHKWLLKTVARYKILTFHKNINSIRVFFWYYFQYHNKIFIFLSMKMIFFFAFRHWTYFNSKVFFIPLLQPNF